MDQFITIIIGAKKQILMKFQAFFPPTRVGHVFSFLVPAPLNSSVTADGKVFNDRLLLYIIIHS
jgi:hypothetical protein